MKDLSIDISWTFDDGPTEFTFDLLKFLHKKNCIPATWFIARHNLYKFDSYSYLAGLQEIGHEIAIHEIHPTIGGKSWFPAPSNSYLSIRDAVDDLKIFCKELSSLGVVPHFVRLPYGEFSELTTYLKTVACPEDQVFQIALNIIDGKSIPTKFNFVQKDYTFLLKSLKQLGLLIWSGSGKEFPLLGGGNYLYNSWQAESAGITSGRGADNVTMRQAKCRKDSGIVEERMGLFEEAVFQVKTKKIERSLVILAHDTSEEDVNKICQDINWMESFTSANGLKIRYKTLSQLFHAIR